MEQSLKEKDDELERVKTHNSELENKLYKLLTEFQQFRNKAQQMLSSKDDELDKLKGRTLSSPKSCKNSEDADSSKKMTPSEKEQLNQDYVKNVFVKYLEYMASGIEKEALTLEKVLFTVLKANDKDIETIERARNKQGGFLSYFYAGSQTTVARPIQPRTLSFQDIKQTDNKNGGIATIESALNKSETFTSA